MAVPPHRAGQRGEDAEVPRVTMKGSFTHVTRAPLMTPPATPTDAHSQRQDGRQTGVGRQCRHDHLPR
jgi:hypothetical protein